MEETFPIDRPQRRAVSPEIVVSLLRTLLQLRALLVKSIGAVDLTKKRAFKCCSSPQRRDVKTAGVSQVFSQSFNGAANGADTCRAGNQQEEAAITLGEQRVEGAAVKPGFLHLRKTRQCHAYRPSLQPALEAPCLGAVCTE